ncbi:MAG: hypothetical protein AAGA85_24735 [Bacteroidota bacterium]
MKVGVLIARHRRVLLILLGNLVAALIVLSSIQAQDASGYMYGKVRTSEATYTGQIRWGSEEAFWSDFFNAAKIADKYYQQILKENSAPEEVEFWEDINWNLSSIWEDKGNLTHEFATQFGNIASIINTSKYRATLRLKNGVELELSGRGYNDIGTKIVVYDDEVGKVEISWYRMREVEFLDTPKDLHVSGGNPIFGTIDTFRAGSFTGYIQWDHDERLGDEKLDGDTRDGDLSIPFRQIKSIEKEQNGSYVVLNSGRDFFLTGSNDVNSQNRGIIVTVPDIGRVDIPWKVFRSATFEQVKSSGPAYKTYRVPKGLSGAVYTFDGDKIEGRIIYDIDEAWEVETLDAKDYGIEYTIPFSNIKAVIPKNDDFSTIVFRNGDKVILGGVRDVSDRNDGALIFKPNKKDPDYVPWKDIAEIVFD